MGRDLETVLDALLDGVVLLSADGAVQLLNVEACRILELGDDAAAGLRIGQMLGSDHPIAVLAERVIETGRPGVRDDVCIQRKYESEIRVDVSISPIFEDREISGGVIVLRDRTIFHSLSEMVSQQDRLTSYGHIAAGIAHEVKNPLGGIRGAAELLSRRVENERQRSAAELIVREVDRITALVEELMVFAKGESLKLERVNVHRILDGALDLVSLDPESNDLKVARAYDPSIPELLGDADRLAQVFLNLARNAMQAMEQSGGTITVKTRMKLDHRLASRSGRGGVATLEVIIQDEGPGIDAEILDQLETPFFTTKVKGTGLGLAVARPRGAGHRGTGDRDSRPGEGARGRGDLPLDGPDALSGGES